MRSPPARLIALVATLAALLAAAAPARAHLFCHMREQVVSECCCPREAAHAHTNEQETARAPDCCERIAASSRADVATTADTSSGVPPSALVAILPAYLHIAAQGEAAAASHALARAPPAIGPPAFLALCRFLI
jgi:hypothetical protein